jgi:hypothetical protein
MKNIGMAILAVCLATLGSMAAQAQSNTNTALGSVAFGQNGSGIDDTAIGMWALSINWSGSDNTALGYNSLDFNIDGSLNTATGSNASVYNEEGNQNTSDGAFALYFNTNSDNSGFGYSALYNTTSGSYNTALGVWALGANQSGSNNIGIGNEAGSSNPAGASNNIDIGSRGGASDSGAIRIGTPGTQKAFFVAGVRGVTTGAKDAIEVMIDENGQLGTVNSSIRFKEDVRDMAAASDGLMRLRPVTYRYKQPYADGSKPIDYGLIAEEVAEVYPDLVVKNADGQIQTVQYQKLTPMLLNEVQKEHKLLEQQEKTIEQQSETIQRQEQSAAQQAETIQRLEKQLSALPLLEKRLAALEAAQPSSTMLESRLETK